MIIFINGSINSGKSTVAKILADKIGQTALMEIDDLRDFIKWLPINEAVPINLENAVLLIDNFVKHQINVIVPYPVSSDNYIFIKEKLKDYWNDVYIFTLSPKLEVALKNRGSRELDDWEKDRINYHYSIGINNPNFGVIIDNSDEEAEETVNRILEMIKFKSQNKQ